MAYAQRRPSVDLARDKRRGCFCVERSLHKIMAIARVTFQRDEQITWLKRTGIDGKAGCFKRVAGLAQRGSLCFGGCPERVHAASAAWPPRATAALIASSLSRKGRISAPTIWPASWPLPA